MCLLETVEQWDTSTILCLATSHQDPYNPLRRGTCLQALAGLEYAAQAMGVHVGLTSPKADPEAVVGYFGAIRDLIVQTERLDSHHNELRISARLLLDQGANFMYRFALTTGEKDLLSGRASIFIRGKETFS